MDRFYCWDCRKERFFTYIKEVANKYMYRCDTCGSDLAIDKETIDGWRFYMEGNK